MKIWLRPVVEFMGEFPDDRVEEDGEILAFPGRNVAEGIQAMLTGLDYTVSEPEHAYEYGWRFEARKRRCRFWLQVQNVDERHYFLNTKDWGMWSRTKDYEAFLQQIDAELRRDGRFSDLKWWPYYQKDGDEPSDYPVDPR